MRPSFIAAIVAGGLLAAAGFAPLFGGPGYESALLAGLVLPATAAIATALEGVTHKRSPLEALFHGAASGSALALVALAVTLLHGVRVGFCDAIAGIALFAAGPGVGALLGGVWGAVVGIAVTALSPTRPKRWVAVALALSGPLSSIAVSVARFYASPMIFAYDPFVGFFSGSIYDTVVDSRGLWTYRIGSLATTIAALAIASHLEWTRDDKLRLKWSGRPFVAALAGIAAAASVAHIVSGPRLHHYQSASSIAAELGGQIGGRRCRVVFARTIPLADVVRFGRECDAHVEQVERFFEVRGPARVTAFLFADSSQKAALMGAADTYIAKPWREEVYVQASGYPHPVLGHEIAHVVAGNFGRGPFRIAGRAGGWIPNPGLIEGAAVAASPGEGELSEREWAKAMKDLGLLPSLDRLFALGFVAQNASTAYTASGAFVGWVRERFGAATLRAWYGGVDLAEATGSSWAGLETDFRASLDRIELGDAARSQAKARFDRPAVFGRRCPHDVDACRARADQLKQAGDEAGALAEYAQLSALDSGDASTPLAVATTKLRFGHLAEAKRDLVAVTSARATPPHVRDRAIEALGDLALIEGDGAEANARYSDVASRLVDQDVLRTLDVKRAAASDASAREPLLALLVGVPPRGPDKLRAAALLGERAATAPEEGLADYLLARQSLASGDYAEALRRLDRALTRRLSIPRVAVEADRLRTVVACALGDSKSGRASFERYVAHSEVSAARKAWLSGFVDRCVASAP
jgi:tetratricopeptide (TPR) repeat protein